MLTLVLGATEGYNEETRSFTKQGGITLQLEHSLVSLSKWESIHEKPFLGESEKSTEEITSYVECMLLTENPPEDYLDSLSAEHYAEIETYIGKKMTATWFSELPGTPKPRNSEIVTSELIYYWMTAFKIPFACETWHLNRLFTLIRICNLKQEKPKKMSRAEVAQRNRTLNEQRKAQLGTKG